MDRNSWNTDIFGEAGLVIYSGLTKIIEKAALPYRLIAITLYDHKVSYDFRVDDSFFDYSFEMPDERSWWDKITDNKADLMDDIANVNHNLQETYKSLIQILVKETKFRLDIDNEKNVSFMNMVPTFYGSFDDIEFSMLSNKKKITFETFANLFNSSELDDFRCHQEPSEPKDETHDEPKVMRSSVVTYRNLKTNEVRTGKIQLKYRYGEDIITEKSPVGKALMGNSKGDIVTVYDEFCPDVPVFEIEILDIS